MRNSTLLRVANAYFVLLVLVPVAVVAATVGNRSGDGASRPNESPQNSITSTNIFTPARVDRPVITIGVSPFNALGRREMSEYQHIDPNVAPGSARAGCMGDECGEMAFHVTQSARALGKDKKCKDKNKNKNKGKPEEECEEKDEDGCCIDEEDGSNEAKNDNGDVDSDSESMSTSDSNSDENETSDSDEKLSGSDSNENGKDDKEKKEAEAAKKAKEKKEAEAKKKKEDEEKEGAKKEAEARKKEEEESKKAKKAAEAEAKKEKEEEEAKEKAEAKEAKKKAEAEAKAKKKEEEDEEKRLKEEAEAKKKAENEAKKKADNGESSQSEEEESKDKTDDKPSDSKDSNNSNEPNKKDSDDDAEKKKANGNDESKDDGSKDKAQSNGGKNEDKKTDGGNDSVKAKPSEPSEDKPSEPSTDEAEKKMGNIDELKEEGDKSKDGSKSDNGKGSSIESKDNPSVESKESGDSEKKSDKVDTGERNKAKSKSEKAIVITDEDKKDSDSKDGGLVGEDRAGKEMKKSARPSRSESNRAGLPLLELVSEENVSGSQGGDDNFAGHNVAVKSKRESKPKIGGGNEAKDSQVAEEKYNAQAISDANHISKNSKTKPTAKSKTGADDGSDNRVGDHSPELKGSRHSSQPLRSKHPQSKLNSRPGLHKSPKDEKIANRVDTDPGAGGDVLSSSRSQNPGDSHGEASHKSSKKSSSVGPGVGSGSSNTLGQSHHPPPTNQRPDSDQSSPSQDDSKRNSQPDLHSPGESNGGGNNRGPIPICLSNCGMRARSSMRECNASIKARSQHHVEECNALSEVLFDDCAYDCIQARGSNYPHDRPHWPRPGGVGNGRRPSGKPHHPGDKPRNTPSDDNESDWSRPRPEPDRSGRGDGADDGADNDCSATCWAEGRRIKRRWCNSKSCPTWVDDYLQRCIHECQSRSTDEGSDSVGGDTGSPSTESNGCDRCSEQKDEKLEWCKGLTGQQRSRKGIGTCTPWTNDWYELCLRRCHGGSNGDDGRDTSDSDDSLDPLQAEIVFCKSSCKANARIKESWCNDSSKDERKERGVSNDNCSDWADELRLKCYDDCYENAKVVEGESIPKDEDDDKSSDKSKNSGNQGGGQKDAPAKQEPQKAKKEQRQDDISKAQDTTKNRNSDKGEDSKKKETPLKDNGFSNDRPWIDNKISDPEEKDKGQGRPPSNAEPPPHPHLPGINEGDPSSTQNTQQGSPAASSSSNPVDISNNGVDIDSFTVDLSIALRSGEGLETIKVRSNSGSVRADQDNLRNRLLIQDGVIRVLRHIMEEELGYHVRQEEWDNRVRQLRQRELVTLHHDIDQTAAHTINLGATSRDGVAVKWIKFSVVYDIVDFLTNDRSAMITGLDVTVRSAGSSQASHLHPYDQQPHLLLTGWQIASAARAAVAGRIRDGTLLQLLRFRGVDALAVTEFGNEASVSFDQGWIDEMPTPSRSPDDTIPVTSIGARTNATGQSWDASRLVGAGVFVLVFGLIVGSAQWAWNRRRQRREMEWTTAGAQGHFHTDNVEYEEWQTRLSPGEGTPSESGGSMVIDVANAIQCDKISSLGIGTAPEASVIGWRPRGGRYGRAPSKFSSIVHNAYDSVSPSDAALDLVGEELDANSRGQLV